MKGRRWLALVTSGLLTAMVCGRAAAAPGLSDTPERQRKARLVAGSEQSVVVVFTTRIVNGGHRALSKPRLTIHAPVDLPQQTISRLEVEGHPVRTQDAWDAPILVYEQKELGAGEVMTGRWVAAATIRQFQWDLPDRIDTTASPVPAQQQASYLRDTPNFAIHHATVTSALKEATRDRQTMRAQLEGIFDLVVNRLRYERDGRWQPAPEVLASGKGSCSEYSYCFIALCRAGGIPARYVGGITGRQGEPFYVDTVFHRYVQAYVPGLGWVDFDPTRTDSSRDRRRYFARTPGPMLLTCVGDGGEGSLTGWDYLESHAWEGKNVKAASFRMGWWFAPPPAPEVQQRTAAFRERLARASTAQRSKLIDEAVAIAHPFVLPWLDDLLYDPHTRVEAAQACLKIGGLAAIRPVANSLGRLSDSEGDRRIGQLLDASASQSFGSDRQKWIDWLNRRGPTSDPTKGKTR